MKLPRLEPTSVVLSSEACIASPRFISCISLIIEVSLILVDESLCRSLTLAGASRALSTAPLRSYG